jgi:hypothetical protein
MPTASRNHGRRRHAASGGLYSLHDFGETVTLRLPEELHHRLAAAATATRRSLEEILLHALRIGSPPAWGNAPPEHQAELEALDRLDDDALWKLARGRRSEADMARYDELLEQSAAGALGEAERSELEMLRREADRFTSRRTPPSSCAGAVTASRPIADRQDHCLTSEEVSGIPLTYDHITPASRGGLTGLPGVSDLQRVPRRIPFAPSTHSHRNLSHCSIRDSSTGRIISRGVLTERKSKAQRRSAGRPW